MVAAACDMVRRGRTLEAADGNVGLLTDDEVAMASVDDDDDDTEAGDGT